jgi:alkylation response protein AidB-like acyl-CoA dehydrogenase
MLVKRQERTTSVTDAPQAWLTKAEAIAHDVLARHAKEVDAAGRWPGESVAVLGQSGLLGLTVPAEFGGAEQGPRTFAAVTRVLAEQCASTAMIYLMHVCATQVLATARQFRQREPVLRAVAAGRHLSTLAFSEKGSRSHFWVPLSQATVNGDTHRITAEKSWVTSAGQADSYIVSTRSATATEPTASTLYWIARDAPGLTVAGPWDGMGLRGNASAPVRLDNVAVPATARVSGEAEGFGVIIDTVLPWFQLGSAAVSVGITRAATESTRQHLLTSKLEHLGQPLAALMNLRARLAQMQVLVDTQLAFLEHVAVQMEHPTPTTLLTVLESKAAAAEAALQVTDLAMRTCGGASFSRHLTVERNFRDARAGWVMAPTTDVLYDFIARALLGMPLL